MRPLTRNCGARDRGLRVFDAGPETAKAHTVEAAGFKGVSTVGRGAGLYRREVEPGFRSALS